MSLETVTRKHPYPRNHRSNHPLILKISSIHPITVHYPLTTLLASYGIDSLIVGRPYLPQMVSAVLPATKILSEISYYGNLAGLVLLAPALITGFHEWWEIAKYKGENKFVDGIVSCGAAIPRMGFKGLTRYRDF
jgi:uncharacterized membrane protein